ncbi:MAG TPA: NTP transferase domain-containing protein [Trueperaceae bacterium]|nr:NTP transferase domain-containing protein [Trueperaceae bacterium]
MDFICLAAGHGTRLGRLGRYLQKCLYPVGLRPFLEHTMVQLLSSGAVDTTTDRLALVIGHHAEQVRAYFGESFEGLPITYVEQAQRLGTGHALKLAHDALQPLQSSVGWQADLFVTAEMFRAVVRHSAHNVVTLGPGDPGESPVLRATVSGPHATKVWEGAGPLYDVGLWKLSQEVLARVADVRASTGEIRMLINLQRCIDAGMEFGFTVTDDWIHLGGTLPTPELNVRRVVDKVLAIDRALEETKVT